MRIMQGEDFSSTDLHLANGDTLLVGQVAEMEQVDPNNVDSSNKVPRTESYKVNFKIFIYIL